MMNESSYHMTPPQGQATDVNSQQPLASQLLDDLYVFSSKFHRG